MVPLITVAFSALPGFKSGQESIMLWFPKEGAISPIAYGETRDLTDASFMIDLKQINLLGNVFLDVVDGIPRLVMLVKNASGGLLNARRLVKFSTSAGRYGLDIAAVTAGDADPLAGLVEEGYKAGVPDGKVFRAVVRCRRIQAYLANQNSARIALTNGDPIVTNSGGEFWGQDTTATGSGLYKQLGTGKVGNVLETTLNDANNRGALKYIALNCIHA
jgi:hypothetical protein